MFAEDLILSATNAWYAITRRTLVRRFRRWVGRSPNVAHPVRYTDRMLWRKLVDRNPDFVMFSDKLASKEYLKRICPELPVARTLWVGSCSDDIPDELLQRDVYVKANHGTNFNYRTRGTPCDRTALRQLTDKWLATLHGKLSGEWPYALVERKLFVEEPVGDSRAGMLDLNVRASNGVPLLGSLTWNTKEPDQKLYFVDCDGQPTMGMDDPEGSTPPPLPPGVDIIEPYRRAIEFTRRLSVGVDYARFDFLWNGTTLYGGEITLFPAAGAEDPANRQAESVICQGWDMRQSHFLKTRHTGLKRLYAAVLRARVEREHAARQNNPTA